MRVTLAAALAAAMAIPAAAQAANSPVLVAFGDGSVRVERELVQDAKGQWVLADGSVRLGDDEIKGVIATFDSDPFIEFAVSFLDNGAPTTLLATLTVPLILGGSNYSYTVKGQALVNYSEKDGASFGTVTIDGKTGQFFGLVDNEAIAAIGSDQLFPAGSGSSSTLYVAPDGAGTGSCVPCTFFAAGIGFAGSGADSSGVGTNYIAETRFDLTLVQPVPLPAAAPLFLGGIAALALLRGRRRAA